MNKVNLGRRKGGKEEKREGGREGGRKQLKYILRKLWVKYKAIESWKLKLAGILTVI
jgi:hypothetical protein